MGIATLIVLLSFGLIFAGVRSLSIAGHRGLYTTVRAIGAVGGVLSLILAFWVLVYPGPGAPALVVFLSYGLLLYGLSRVGMASTHKAAPTGLRGLGIAIGVMTSSLRSSSSPSEG